MNMNVRDKIIDNKLNRVCSLKELNELTNDEKKNIIELTFSMRFAESLNNSLFEFVNLHILIFGPHFYGLINQ